MIYILLFYFVELYHFTCLSALHLACQNGNLSSIKILLTESNVDVEAVSGRYISITLLGAICFLSYTNMASHIQLIYFFLLKSH